MAKKPRISQKLKRLIEARRREPLSPAQIQVAKELDINAKKFGKLDNHDEERWKSPLGQLIEECCRKRFGQLPTTMLSFESRAPQREKRGKARSQDGDTAGGEDQAWRSGSGRPA
jgi:hypothetical protein